MVQLYLANHRPTMAAVKASQPSSNSEDSALEHVLRATGPVLLDFDGPITFMFTNGRNRMVSDLMRSHVPDQVTLPLRVRETVDPLEVLRWSASTASPEVQAAIESAAVRGELMAVAQSAPTDGIAEVLEACHAAYRPVVIVSNNSHEAINAFLIEHDLAPWIDEIVPRIPNHPELMKPHPAALLRAATSLTTTPSRCALVGDSITDVEACLAAGVRSIGFAKTTRRGQELRAARADAVITSMTELAQAIRSVA